MLPREKLLKMGPSALKDEELLAILIGTGRSGEHVLSLARKILKMFPIERLSTVDVDLLMMVDGLGPAKATRILAAIELGRRLFDREGRIIYGLEDVFEAVRRYASSRKEQLIGIAMDGAGRMLGMEVLAVGGRNVVYVSMRDIAEMAIRYGARSMAFAHNHPSGNLVPSREDRKLTARIMRFLKEMEVDFFGHIVFSEEGFVAVEPLV